MNANTQVLRMKKGTMKNKDLHYTLFEKLENFRKQGKNISELNPILALADDICEQIYQKNIAREDIELLITCLLYTSPSPRDATLSRMPSSA